jgi:hypothetical protein
MGRLVDPKPAGPTAVAAGAKPDHKAYLERVAKYVPAEVIAAYLVLIPIVEATSQEGSTLQRVLLGVVLLVGLVFTPLYLRAMAEVGQPKRVHQIIASIAFLIWTYSVGGLFTELGWYQAGVSAVLLVVFSLTSGLIVPTIGTK